MAAPGELGDRAVLAGADVDERRLGGCHERIELRGRQPEQVLEMKVGEADCAGLVGHPDQGRGGIGHVAEARLGGCWGKANKFWDIAAGLVLAQLSGAKVKWRVLDPKKHLVSYIATTPGAWEKAYGRLEGVLGLS